MGTEYQAGCATRIVFRAFLRGGVPSYTPSDDSYFGNARPYLRAPLVTPVRRAEPLAQIEPVSRSTVKPPAIAKVTAGIMTGWPMPASVSPVSSAASSRRTPIIDIERVGPPKAQGRVGAAIRPVRQVASSAHEPDLRPVASRRRTRMSDIRTASPKAYIRAIEPIITRVGSPRTGSASPVRPAVRTVSRGIDTVLAKTMRAFEERLARIAASLAQGRTSHASSAGQEIPTIAEKVLHTEAADARPLNEAVGEVQAARAFIGRVRNKAIHVGTDEDGLILPQPVYWPGNRLTRRGLSDPQVQAELGRMERRQADYMRHIHSILRETVTARLLSKGSPAIIDKLPEEERARAEAWAKTGVWSSLMRMVTEEGERRSRRALKRWRTAREKADGSHFVSAAIAQEQWKRWPVHLAPDHRQTLKQDAQRHRAALATQQALTRPNGIG